MLKVQKVIARRHTVLQHFKKALKHTFQSDNWRFSKRGWNYRATEAGLSTVNESIIFGNPPFSCLSSRLTRTTSIAVGAEWQMSSFVNKVIDFSFLPPFFSHVLLLRVSLKYIYFFLFPSSSCDFFGALLAFFCLAHSLKTFFFLTKKFCLLETKIFCGFSNDSFNSHWFRSHILPRLS